MGARSIIGARWFRATDEEIEALDDLRRAYVQRFLSVGLSSFIDLPLINRISNADPITVSLSPWERN